MATPVVAGSATLARQYFMDGYYPSGKKNDADKMTPSGALIKAVLISGTHMPWDSERRLSLLILVTLLALTAGCVAGMRCLWLLNCSFVVSSMIAWNAFCPSAPRRMRPAMCQAEA